MQQMKHQEELIDKHKAKWYKIFPYPMPYVITQPQEKDETKKRYFVVDILSYFYYYIFLIFRYKFPIVAYELKKETIDFGIKKGLEETERMNNKKQPAFLKYFTMLVAPIAVWTNRALKKHFYRFLVFYTPHAQTYNMLILALMLIIILYEIIKRTNELKKAFKLDGVKKYKIRVIKKEKIPFKYTLIFIGVYIFFILCSSFVFMLPKDQIILFFSIPLPFVSVYCWWIILNLQYLGIEEIEILKELEYK